jgi:predicted AAA+ superfamily ATPase
MGGAVFENAVLVEIAKVLMNRGEDPHIYFWRTSVGSEVDIVVEVNDRLIPIEVKLSATPRPSMSDSIDAFRRDVGRKAARGYVVHPGGVRLPLSPDVLALPFAEL